MDVGIDEYHPSLIDGNRMKQLDEKPFGDVPQQLNELIFQLEHNPDIFNETCASMLNYSNIPTLSEQVLNDTFQKSIDLSNMHSAILSLKLLRIYFKDHQDEVNRYYQQHDNFSVIKELSDSILTDIFKDYLIAFIECNAASLHLMNNIKFTSNFYLSFLTKKYPIKTKLESEEEETVDELHNFLLVNEAIFNTADEQFFKSVPFSNFISTMSSIIHWFEGQDLILAASQVILYYRNNHELDVLQLIFDNNLYDILIGIYNNFSEETKFGFACILKYLAKVINTDERAVIEEPFLSRFSFDFVKNNFDTSPYNAQIKFLGFAFYILKVSAPSFIQAYNESFFDFIYELLENGTLEQKHRAALIYASILAHYPIFPNQVQTIVLEKHIIGEIIKTLASSKNTYYILANIVLFYDNFIKNGGDETTLLDCNVDYEVTDTLEYLQESTNLSKLSLVCVNFLLSKINQPEGETNE